MTETATATETATTTVTETVTVAGETECGVEGKPACSVEVAATGEAWAAVLVTMCLSVLVGGAALITSWGNG